MSRFKFNPNTTRYSAINALGLVKASKLAYDEEEEIKAKIQKWGFNRLRFFDKEETQAFMIANEEMILTAFRGTEPTHLKDWMTDVDIELKQGPGGNVHDGFQRALNHVWQGILESLEVFQTEAQSLWFTGHSLGGALATLAVARLREEDRPVHGLYTFGQPRVGDREFAKNFNIDFKTQAFRFVNNNDVVTRVPLRLMGYSHIGTFLYMDSRGKLHQDIHYWNKFLDRLQGRIDDFLVPGTEGMKDHFMNRYETNLERNARLGGVPLSRMRNAARAFRCRLFDRWSGSPPK